LPQAPARAPQAPSGAPRAPQEDEILFQPTRFKASFLEYSGLDVLAVQKLLVGIRGYIRNVDSSLLKLFKNLGTLYGR